MGKKPNTPESFWALVEGVIPSECWEWQGYKTKRGYGMLNYQGKHSLAHRVSYLLTHGSIQDSACILHTCDNPPCCNPNHLYSGTQMDNARDRESRNRGNQPKGSKNLNAKINEVQALEIRSSKAPTSELSKKYNISYSTIQRIRNGTRWKHTP